MTARILPVARAAPHIAGASPLPVEQAYVIKLATEGVGNHVVHRMLHATRELRQGLADPEARELLLKQAPDERNRVFAKIHIAETARQTLGV